MMVFATGINYVTETFAYIGQAVAAGFGWLQDLLLAIGLPWEVYSVFLIGMAVSYMLIAGVVDNFRGSADSILSDHASYQRRQAAIQAREDSKRSHARYMEIYKERTDMYKERNKRLIEYWNNRHLQKWKE